MFAPRPDTTPTPADIRRWRRYLAEERTEGATYRYLAARREGEERAILLSLADAEQRHEQHWRDLLGDKATTKTRAGLRSRTLNALARRFGSIFVLALAQRAESRSPYADDLDASATMAADEQIHEEVVRGLAERGRARMSGTFRAAVFGANDGLVSNLALVVGMSASGVGSGVVLTAGVAGLLAGALSMAAGEFVSVRSQIELLRASNPNPDAQYAVPQLDVDANELALVYRARGMDQVTAEEHATEQLHGLACAHGIVTADESLPSREEESIGSAMGAATSSFFFFASGALIPVLPYLFGLTGFLALGIAAVLVGLALLLTGATVGLLSGASPLKRALRQLAIGYGAAAATYLLGLLFGTTVA